MYDLGVGPHHYADPWDVPLSRRTQHFQREAFKIAYYYDVPDNSSFRYRCFAMAEAVNDYLDGASASWFWRRDGRALIDLVKHADVLVVCRAAYSAELDFLVSVAKNFGVRVIYDVDDLVFDPKYVPLVVSTLDQNRTPSDQATDDMWRFWFGYVARNRAALDLADSLIVPNDYLAARAAESVTVPISVVPNFMSRGQIDYSRHLVGRRNESGRRRTGALHLGYFSGTPTHNRDFALAVPAIARLMESRPHVALRIVGYLDVAASPLARFGRRIEVEPLVDFMNLQRLIAQTEINVAPLQDNLFTNCKSELKYFDAAAVAVPTIASGTHTMSRAITHGENGLVVADHEWDDALALLVDNYDSTGVQLGEAAFADIDRYSGAAASSALAAALGLDPGRDQEALDGWAGSLHALPSVRLGQDDREL